MITIRVLAIIIVSLLLILVLVDSSRNYLFDIRYRVERIEFRSGKYLLKGSIYIPGQGSNRRAILISHGFNRLGAKHYLYKEMSERLAMKGYTVMSFDYRGFGLSEGPSEVKETKDLDFTADAKMALHILMSKFPYFVERIVVGHSFGAGVALKVGVEDKNINKIVCISPGRRAMSLYFSDKPILGKVWIQEHIKKEMRIKLPVSLELIPKIFVPITIDTFKNKALDKPVLFIDGGAEPEEDLLFLRNYVRKLKAPNKSYITIPDARHYFGVVSYTKIYNSAIIQKLVDAIDKWIYGKK